jgi:hypothetical protein
MPVSPPNKITQYLKNVPNLYTKCVLLYVIAYIVIIIIHDAFFRVPDEVIPGVLGVYNAPTLSGLESLGLLIGFLLIMVNGIFVIIDLIK